MLAIVLKSKDSIGMKDANTLVQHIPFVNMPSLVNEEIDYVQADGDELEHIQNQLHHKTNNVPTHINRAVVRWDGDLAKFIYYNIVR